MVMASSTDGLFMYVTSPSPFGLPLSLSLPHGHTFPITQEGSYREAGLVEFDTDTVVILFQDATLRKEHRDLFNRRIDGQSYAIPLSHMSASSLG